MEWQKTYYNDTASGYNSIKQTLDGGYILAGTIVKGFLSYGASLLKLNADGSVAWEKSFGKGETHAYSALQASDGGYVIVGGTSHSFGDLTGMFALELGIDGDIPNCPILQSSVTTVTDTDVTGKDANVVGVDTTFSPEPAIVIPLDTSAAVDTLCFSPLPPGVTVEPSAIDFRDIVVGSFSDKVLTITNQGNENLTIGTISSPQAPFFNLEDTCSGQSLPPGKSCALTVRFSPTHDANYQGHFDILFTGPEESVVPVWLQGAGKLIALSSPSDNASFGACSLYSPVTFSWVAGDVFKNFEIQFSSDNSFSSAVLEVRSPGTAKDIDSRTWRKILLTPGGIVYWRVIGEKVNGNAVESEVRTIKIESVQPVGNPRISPISKMLLPELTWANNCNVRFKVWFGGDNSFTKTKKLTFDIANPTGSEGEFSEKLSLGQWKAIRKLVGDVAGSTIYWYVDSWDRLNRSAKTEVMSFMLTD